MRYRYTVELTVDELDFSATEAEHLRAALREVAEEYATGEVKEFIMPNTDKSAVEIEWVLDTPVREDIYEYIVNG